MSQFHHPLDALKQRELEVLRLIAEGLSNEEIAARLFVEVSTVRWHNRQVYSKLGVHSRTLAVARARALGLLDDNPSQISSEAASTDRSNLPAQTTSFIGRERDITKLRQFLTASRLLTLTGPGGTGKTRLALEVAESVKREYADGVWFVSLAAVHDPALVAGAIADVLKVTEIAAESLEASLVKSLRDKQILLVIDNFEHVIEAAPLLSTLLAGAAAIRVVVTSREVLRLYGEQEYPVSVLTVPNKEATYTAESLAQFEAVRLFMERAQSNQPEFQLTDRNADAVAGICARLDGLPLAIELAAARAKLLAPPQLLARLERGLNALGQGPRDAPARQRTLNATIDWSYQLLTADEKRLFNQLGVFRGGWSLEALEAICAEGLSCDVFDGLAALVDKSLVRQGDGHDGELRFTLLETLREYALEQLSVIGETDKLSERHARYYVEWCRAAGAGMAGAAQLRWARRLQADYDNLRAAMEWTEQHDPVLGLLMVEALTPFWEMRGHMAEGLRWAERVLAAGQDSPSEIRLGALISASEVARYMGNTARGVALGEEALMLAQRFNHPVLLARSLFNMANSGVQRHLSSEDLIETKAMLEHALAILREKGEPLYRARVLNSLGELARLSSDDRQARQLYTEALQTFRASGNHWLTTVALLNLGFVALRHREYEQARALYSESLDICQQMEDVWGMAVSAEGLAFVIGMTSDGRRAARLLGAAEALREQMDAAVQVGDQPDYEQHIDAIRARLNDEEFATEWRAGRGMSLEQLVTELKEE